MPQAFPKFTNPPVVETVLGVQFAKLPGWTSGHGGWYWKRYLSDEWESAADAPPVQDQFELFGEERQWANPGLMLQLVDAIRLQISNKGGDRMIQLQPSCFLYNWQKQNTVYPSYQTMLTEFKTLFAAFLQFAAEAKLGEVVPNQWELTYVDHFPRGGLWETPADWHRIVPGLLTDKAALGGLPSESINAEWHYLIEPARGRVHVSLKSGRTTAAQEDSEVLLMQTTARGPIRQEPGWGLDEGLELGHNAVIAAFMEATSAEAHQAWGIVEG
jgi:uncharacterized protein (TIGR04255 family)